MPRPSNQITKLKTLIRLAQELLNEAEAAGGGRVATNAAAKGKAVSATKRPPRRSGKELIAFRKMLKAERKKGVPVAELAKQHGISTVYIYKLG
jgi:hypothetical protein